MKPVIQGYSSTPPSIHEHALPFTGFDVGFLVVGSVILLTLGVTLRRLLPSE